MSNVGFETLALLLLALTLIATVVVGGKTSYRKWKDREQERDRERVLQSLGVESLTVHVPFNNEIAKR